MTRDPTAAPSEAEVRALEAQVERARQVARQFGGLERQQAGAIRKASSEKARRKAAKRARKRNRQR